MAVLAGKLKARRRDCAPVAGKSTLNRLELSRPGPRAITRSAMIRPPSRGCSSICSWRRTPSRRSRSSSISTPPTIRCTAIRKGGSSTAITIATAICRSTCSAAGISWRPSCGRSNIDGAAGSVEEMARIVGANPPALAEVRILLRADSGFCREDLMDWCEANRVDYLFGLARNVRLTARSPLNWRSPSRSRTHRKAGPPLQGLHLVHAQKLEPVAPRRRARPSGPRARPIRASS